MLTPSAGDTAGRRSHTSSTRDRPNGSRITMLFTGGRWLNVHVTSAKTNTSKRARSAPGGGLRPITTGHGSAIHRSGTGFVTFRDSDKSI